MAIPPPPRSQSGPSKHRRLDVPALAFTDDDDEDGGAARCTICSYLITDRLVFWLNLPLRGGTHRLYAAASRPRSVCRFGMKVTASTWPSSLLVGLYMKRPLVRRCANVEHAPRPFHSVARFAGSMLCALPDVMLVLQVCWAAPTASCSSAGAAAEGRAGYVHLECAVQNAVHSEARHNKATRAASTPAGPTLAGFSSGSHRPASAGVLRCRRRVTPDYSPLAIWRPCANRASF